MDVNDLIARLNQFISSSPTSVEPKNK